MGRKKTHLNHLSDEDLLKLLREGEAEARDVLSVRYFRMRTGLIYKVNPEAATLIDEWDLNEAFFMSYLKAEANYEFDKDMKFSSFVCLNLKHELSNLVRKELRNNEAVSLLSFDEPIYHDYQTEGFSTFSNAAIGDSANEPAEYMNLLSLIEGMCVKKCSNYEEMTRFIALIYAGYSVLEASNICDISLSKGRQILRTLREMLQDANLLKEVEAEMLSEQKKTPDLVSPKTAKKLPSKAKSKKHAKAESGEKKPRRRRRKTKRILQI